MLLPGFVLGWLALRSAEEQQIIFERRTAELYQKETESVAAAARDVIEAERRAFGDTVHRLLARSDAQALARDFTNSLMDAWPRKAIGFVLGNDGEMLSPTTTMAAKNRDLRNFLWDNGTFLCSTQPAVVYPVQIEANAKALSYGQAMKSRAASPSEGKPALTVSNSVSPGVLAQKGAGQNAQQRQAPQFFKELIQNDAVASAAPAQVEESANDPSGKAKAESQQQKDNAQTSQQARARQEKSAPAPMAPAAPAPLPDAVPSKRGVAHAPLAPSASVPPPTQAPVPSPTATAAPAPPARSATSPESPAPPASAAAATRQLREQVGIHDPATAPLELAAAPLPANEPAPEAEAAQRPSLQPARKTDDLRRALTPQPAMPAGRPTTAGAAGDATERFKTGADAPGSLARVPIDESGESPAPVSSPKAAADTSTAPAQAAGQVALSGSLAELRGRPALQDDAQGGAGVGQNRGFARANEAPTEAEPTAQGGGAAGVVQQTLGNNAPAAGSSLAYGRYNPDTQNRMVEPQQQVRSAVSNWSALLPATADFRALTAGNDEGMLARFVQDKLDLIFWIRPPEAPEMVFGCLVEAADLEPLWKDLFAARVAETQDERPPFVLALLNDKARPVATFPATEMNRDWKRPFVADEVGEVLPHWEAALYLATPTAMADTARGLRRTLSFTIAGAIALIAIGGWLVVHDVRRQLALAQQKTDFVSNVSHELKTPLTSIRMFAELMHDRPPAAEKQGQYLRIIRVEAERLTRLINNVLDFAKLERRQRRFDRKPLDLCAVITGVWEGHEMHLRDAGFTTQWQAAPGPYPVLGDEDALAQILVNLLSNAEKYSQERKDIELVTWVNGEWVNASILDRGIGVPDGEERKIFEAFYRAHDSLSSGIQGSGLGLTLAQRVAREHGGEILFERRQDGGSRFTLRLPLVHPQADDSPARTGAPAD